MECKETMVSLQRECLGKKNKWDGEMIVKGRELGRRKNLVIIGYISGVTERRQGFKFRI